LHAHNPKTLKLLSKCNKRLLLAKHNMVYVCFQLQGTGEVGEENLHMLKFEPGMCLPALTGQNIAGNNMEST